MLPHLHIMLEYCDCVTSCGTVTLSWCDPIIWPVSGLVPYAAVPVCTSIDFPEIVWKWLSCVDRGGWQPLTNRQQCETALTGRDTLPPAQPPLCINEHTSMYCKLFYCILSYIAKDTFLSRLKNICDWRNCSIRNSNHTFNGELGWFEIITTSNNQKRLDSQFPTHTPCFSWLWPPTETDGITNQPQMHFNTRCDESSLMTFSQFFLQNARSDASKLPNSVCTFSNHDCAEL